MPQPAALPAVSRKKLATLRAELAGVRSLRGPALPFDVPMLDDRMAAGGIDGAGLHEIAAASSRLGDDAAASLFAAGIAARFASKPGFTVLWALSRFDLYAPGLEQVGLGPSQLLYAQGKNDQEVLAVTEDALRDGSLACVIAEVKTADMTATRRLQLAASDGKTPMLLYRRHRTRDQCPLTTNSSAMTRWRIGCVPSLPPPHLGVGRPRWSVELVRQRGGNPFSLDLDSCDDKGCLAHPSLSVDRAIASAGKTSQAAGRSSPPRTPSSP
jgi:protein ImuA